MSKGILSVGSDSIQGYTRIARVRTPQSVTNSSSAVPINELSVPIIAGESYVIRAFVPFSLDDVAGGYKFSFTGGAETLGVRYLVFNGVTFAIASDTFRATVAGAVGALASIGNHTMIFEGTLLNVIGSGDFTIRFAQSSAGSGIITVLPGAYLAITKIP